MFGYGGLTSKNREILSHSMVPNYVKQAYGGVPMGEKLQRKKGGWTLKTLRKFGHETLSRFGTHWFNGRLDLSSNFEGYWDENNGVMAYEYGRSWSLIRQENETIVIPF